jgi:diguanylate cyclase (GGDEF)-like protein
MMAALHHTSQLWWRLRRGGGQKLVSRRADRYDGSVSDSDPRGTAEHTLITERKLPIESQPGEHQAYLVIIYGDQLGKRIPLGLRQVDAGRSSDCEIPIDQESVSRRHARISWTGSAYSVRDLGSTNGTYLNDKPITTHDLSDGDQIKVGHTILKFMSGGNVEASYHEEIYRMMTSDGLTQVYNKRYFHETLEREISRCRRYVRELGLVLFDIDHFKQKNDTYGHLAGDAILRELARVVRAKLRREDIFARVGGEEFAILTPEVGLLGVHEVAEKVRAVVARTSFTFEQHVMSTTVSLGVAAFTGKADTPDDLYRRADAGLYQAKQGGRNRTGQV